jgi:hypothetical protein
MDFIMGLPRTSCWYNLIWVIVDRLTKSAYFIPISTTYRVRQYTELYLSHIVRYHGILRTIICDKGSIFMARFWKQLHDCLGTHLICSSAYHPQMNGQTKRVNQIIKDMLHTCALNDGPKWDQRLPLAEFSYNNNYQESIKTSPFEAFYGRPCHTLLCWSEIGKQVIFGPDIVIEAEEKVRQIRANILTAQSRQKTYTDKRRCPLEFEVGDHVNLQVSPMKGVHHFGIKGKLAPLYISLYPVIDKYGPTSYRVEQPSKLSGVHNVFHISQLKGCMKSPTNVVVEDTIPLEPNLTYKIRPIKVLDQQDRVTRSKTTRFYKIQWNDHSEDEATWGHEDFLQSNYPKFLPSR